MVMRFPTDTSKIINGLEDMKSTIVRLKASTIEAKARQDEAATDVKRIERDMNEFSKNKGGKLAELQATLETSKKSQAKSAAALKPLQQEDRETKLDMEQCGGDLATAQEGLEETNGTVAAQEKEVAELVDTQEQIKVSYR